jgi:hypothetical protein
MTCENITPLFSHRARKGWNPAPALTCGNDLSALISLSSHPPGRESARLRDLEGGRRGHDTH